MKKNIQRVPDEKIKNCPKFADHVNHKVNLPLFRFDNHYPTMTDTMKNFLKMQRDIQQNNAILSSYHRDLNNWMSDIDAKDEELKKKNKSKNSEKNSNFEDTLYNNQPIRSKVKQNRSVINKTTTTDQENKPIKKKISVNDAIPNRKISPTTTPEPTSQTEALENMFSQKSTSKTKVNEVKPKPGTVKNNSSMKPIKQSSAPRTYNQWDKFDYDAALDSAEEEDEANSDETGKENNNAQKLLDESNLLKLDGNEKLMKGKYNEAVKLYSQGIDICQENAALFANRGWAYYKLNRNLEAEIDYSRALALDPIYIKVIKRRAKVRLDLNKLASARKDLNRILQLEPKDKEAKQMLENIGKSTVKTELPKTESLKTMAEKQEKSQKPLEAKTKVEEIRYPRVRTDLEKPAPKIIPVDMKMYEIPIEGIVTSTNNQSKPIQEKSNKNFKKTKIVQEKSIINKNETKLEDDPAQFDAKMKELDAMTEELKKAQISLKDVSEKPKEKEPLKEKTETEKQATNAPKTNITKPTKNLQPQPQKSLPPPAETSFKFFQTFRKLDDSSKPTWLLSHKNIPALLKDQIDTDHASDIILAFENSDENDVSAKEFLQNFRKMPRLDILLMMVDDKVGSRIEKIGERFGIEFDV